MPIKRAQFASLFSGCGGFDLGFLTAGFQCRGAWDSDPVAVATYRQNHGKCVRQADLLDDQSGFREIRGIDVLIAGPPCQGFSTAGKRDLRDQRNHLVVRAAEIAVTVRPKVIAIENVAGVLAGQHQKYWKRMKGILEAAGYSVAELVCDAASHGVAQRRRRVIALATRTKLLKGWTLPVREAPTLKSLLSDIGTAADHQPTELRPESKPGKIAPRISPGQKLCNVRAAATAVHTWHIPEVFGRTSFKERLLLDTLLLKRRQNRRRDFGDADPVAARDLAPDLPFPITPILEGLLAKAYIRKINRRYDLVHTFNGKFRRLRLDQPSPTVDTRFGDPWFFLHPFANRSFTPREAARIQGFPDNFTFCSGERAKYRLIGNAVPPPLAECLATFIKTQLL